ncbi:unnamed protein product [Peniophora sp. CBMAI 1063]|nr:unnamed protein product [Peniophora sp. CBMAI 1063]
MISGADSPIAPVVESIDDDTKLSITEDDELDHVTGDGRAPTTLELATLRRVSAPVPWPAYLVCFAELAERASYFGCTAVFTNFIQRPLPIGGNGAGAPPAGTQETAGALGLGLPAASGISLTFSFLALALPIFAGVLADTRLGMFKMIFIASLIGIVGHVVLVVAAVPTVLRTGHAIIPFAIALFILAIASAAIKACVTPIITHQCPIDAPRVQIFRPAKGWRRWLSFGPKGVDGEKVIHGQTVLQVIPRGRGTTDFCDASEDFRKGRSKIRADELRGHPRTPRSEYPRTRRSDVTDTAEPR